MTKYGYTRVSTGTNAENSLQDLSRQVLELKKMGVEESNIYKEYASGSRTDRVQLNKLLSEIKEGDQILCTELSRISRSTKNLIEIVELAKKKRLKLVFGNLVVNCDQERIDTFTSTFLMILSIFSEFEVEIIKDRIRSGLDNCRAKGIKLGRKSTTINDIPEKFFKNYQLYKDKKINKKELAAICGLSYPTIFKYISIIENK